MKIYIIIFSTIYTCLIIAILLINYGLFNSGRNSNTTNFVNKSMETSTKSYIYLRINKTTEKINFELLSKNDTPTNKLFKYLRIHKSFIIG